MKKLFVIISTALITTVVGTFAQTDDSKQAPVPIPKPIQSPVPPSPSAQIEDEADIAQTDDSKQAPVPIPKPIQAPVPPPPPAQIEDKADALELSRNMEKIKKDFEKRKRDIEKQAEQIRAGLGGSGFGKASSGNGSSFGGGSFFGKRFGSSQRQDAPLIIWTTAPDAKAQTQLSEDLTVMRHLLEKSMDDNASSEARRYKAMGIDVFMPSSGPSVRSLYLQGVGALFILNVNYPLVAPEKPADTPKSTGSSSEWEKAKREVYGQLEEMNDDPPGEAFDGDKVTKLQERIIEALKNGSNIRSLKSGESVTVTINGGSNVNGVGRKVVVGSKTIVNGKEVKQSRVVDGGVPNRTMLVVSVSKADLDALSGGKIKEDEFRKKVTLTSYVDDSQSEDSQLSPTQMKAGF